MFFDLFGFSNAGQGPASARGTEGRFFAAGASPRPTMPCGYWYGSEQSDCVCAAQERHRAPPNGVTTPASTAHALSAATGRKKVSRDRFHAGTLPSAAQWCIDAHQSGARIVSGHRPQKGDPIPRQDRPDGRHFSSALHRDHSRLPVSHAEEGYEIRSSRQPRPRASSARRW